MAFRVVVLPHPDAPNSATRSPGPTWKLTPSTLRVRPRSWLTTSPSTSSTVRYRTSK